MASINDAADLIYAVQDEAMSHAGFIIASQRPGQLGFSFLVRKGSLIVALHGIAVGGKPFRLGACHKRKDAGDESFVETYFGAAAQIIGMSRDDLEKAIIEGCGRVGSLWRFVGFVNGKCSDAPDNGDLWQPLWRRLEGIAASGHVPRGGMRRSEVRILTLQLRNCAVEGQIVLDR